MFCDGEKYETVMMRFYRLTTAFCSESSVVRDTSLVDDVAHLLGVSSENLMHVFTHKTIRTGFGRTAETYAVPLNAHKASTHAKAVARALYSHLFDFIVQRINDALDSLR